MADPDTDTDSRNRTDADVHEQPPRARVKRAAASVENVMKAMRKVGRAPRRIEAELRRR